MIRKALAAASVFTLAACTTTGTTISNPFAPKPETAQEALSYYYATIPNSDLPVAPAGKALPGDTTVISEILIGSCLDEEKGPSAAMQSIAGEGADLFLMIGDNVYGDRDGRAYTNNDPDLGELKESFADLAKREDFQAVRNAVPMMVAWDDHDYGANDAGSEFVFREFAERMHEVFWGLDSQDVGQWEGTYYERSFGPEGQRVQVIMLDTRSFRTALTPTDEWGAKGKERYLPAAAGSMQDMLGGAQWTWLENQLQKPADIRVIASSIQVMPTTHGWEAWSTMPDERQRLFDLIKTTEATGVVFASGDRHTSFLYEESDVLPYTAGEVTGSSLNVSFRDTSDEVDERQIGAGFAPENYGAINIDWAERKVVMSIKDNEGKVVRQNTLSFAELGVD